jgi:hypothetical protein
LQGKHPGLKANHLSYLQNSQAWQAILAEVELFSFTLPGDAVQPGLFNI